MQYLHKATPGMEHGTDRRQRAADPGRHPSFDPVFGVSETLEEEAMSERSCENCVYEYVCDWHEANEEYSCGDWLPDLSVTEPRKEIT